MTRPFRSTVAAAVLSLTASGLFAVDATAQASRSWSVATLDAAAQAQTCGAFGRGRVCATLYCGADGVMQFGLTGLSGTDGATREGSLQVGSSATTAPFVREEAAPIGTPVWRLQNGAPNSLLARLARSSQLTVDLGGGLEPFAFSLRGSSRAAAQVRRACGRLEREARRGGGGGGATGPLGALETQPQGGGAATRTEPPRGGRLSAADNRVRRIYTTTFQGRWGTPELCRTGGGWAFGQAAFTTPTGVTCSQLRVTPGEGPAIRVEGSQCDGAGAGRTVIYELSPAGRNMLLTRGTGQGTSSFILRRCGR